MRSHAVVLRRSLLRILSHPGIGQLYGYSGSLPLTNFGFSKVAQRTVKASGSGTLGYLAPEQALGRPMFQSDVFALGLVVYQLFSGKLPEYPYSWPMPGCERIRSKLRRRTIAWLRKSLEFRHQDRFRDAVAMEKAFQDIRLKLAKRD